MPDRFLTQAHATHLVELTPDRSGLLDGAATFLGEGLTRRDHVLAFVPAAGRAALLQALEERGFAVEVLLEKKVLQIISSDALVPALASPDPARVSKNLEVSIFGTIREAITAAASGRVRVYSELCSLLWSARGAEQAEALERQFNAFCYSHPVTLFCGYGLPADISGGEQLRALHSELLWDPRGGVTEQRLRLLARASALLASTLDFDETLAHTIELVIPVLGDFGFFDLLEPDGSARRIARAHNAPELEAALSQTRWVRNERKDMNLCGLSTGASGYHPMVDDEWLRRAAASPEHYEVMKSLGFCSMITVPLISQQRPIGALTLFHAASGRHHTRGDLALCEELARRSAAAVENTRLYRDLRQAIRDRDDADRRKDEFLAMLGHELRNPLAPILTAARLLELKGDPTIEREREVIARQAEHLTRLVDDLLDVSRIVRGKIALRPERLLLIRVLERAAEVAAPLVEAREHQVRVDIPPSLQVDGDPERLAQVFGNLLTNAAKYTEPGGLIELSATSDDAEVRVSVRDNGVGISADHLGRLFEQFFQAESSLDRSHGGLGLGLALVRSLTEAHGGRVTAQSDGPGKGSCFTVTLPLPAKDSAGLAPQPEITVSRRGGRLLVVDDNEDLAETLGEALRFSGFEVEVVHDAAQALAAAATLRFDAALVDIGLPVMDGYELARRLRALTAQTRLIAVSGYGTEKDRQRSVSAGFETHLVKPVDFAELLRLLDETQPPGRPELSN